MTIMIGTRKGLFFWSRKQHIWQIAHCAFLGDPVVAVLQHPQSKHLYAAIDHGHFGNKLHRSVDQGQTWEEISAPSYPSQPQATAEDKADVLWSLKLIWCLEADRVTDQGLWCGTLPGGLFHSTDGGDSWQLIRSLWDHPARREWVGGGADQPGIHSILVDPRDPRIVTIGISCGGVWQTTDGGQNWQCRATGMRAAYMPPERQYDPNIQDPHRLSACHSHPDIIWAQHHNGIFRSTDQAQSWQEIENAQPSSFGFAVAVHPEDGNCAWFVPGIKDEKRYPVDSKLVVMRTRDGGASFETLHQGLPKAHAYDLVFRHALDIDASGKQLAFGSTTGNAWISADQGDHWHNLSHHLPPIYCVRFIQD